MKFELDELMRSDRHDEGLRAVVILAEAVGVHDHFRAACAMQWVMAGAGKRAELRDGGLIHPALQGLLHATGPVISNARDFSDLVYESILVASSYEDCMVKRFQEFWLENFEEREQYWALAVSKKWLETRDPELLHAIYKWLLRPMSPDEQEMEIAHDDELRHYVE